VDFVGRYFGVRQANSGQARLDVLAKSDFEILARLPNLCDTNAVQRASRPLKEASGHARAAWTEPHAFKQVVELASVTPTKSITTATTASESIGSDAGS
jgi:hypothetical protein